jgi:hypothetical protein
MTDLPKYITDKIAKAQFYNRIKAKNRMNYSVRRRAGEHYQHFIMKALTFFLLEEMGHKALTEVEASDDGVYDVLDMTTQNIYEIQGDLEVDKLSQYTSYDIKDVIIIPTKGAPTDIGHLRAYIQRYLI